jgi:predicted nucleotidyltransferase
MNTEALLQGLVERLRAAFGEDLASMVLYGSAATGEFHEKHSDLNVLGVLRQVGLTELERAAEPVGWWLKQGQPAPVLLSVEEVERGSDAFPIEFLDMRASYRLLHGADLLQGIEIHTDFHRRQVEHELRSRLLRLRKRFLETQHDNQALARLMLESLPTFAALFRHALLLAGTPAPLRKHDIFQQAAERFGLDPEPFERLLEVREGNRSLPPTEAHAWFGAYLAEITRLSAAVDRL